MLEMHDQHIYTHTHISFGELSFLFLFLTRIFDSSNESLSPRTIQRAIVDDSLRGDLTSSMQVSRNGPRAPRTRNRLQMLKAAAPGTLPLPDTGETN